MVVVLVIKLLSLLEPTASTLQSRRPESRREGRDQVQCGLPAADTALDATAQTGALSPPGSSGHVTQAGRR
jgi:hypothetical protein